MARRKASSGPVSRPRVARIVLRAFLLLARGLATDRKSANRHAPHSQCAEFPRINRQPVAAGARRVEGALRCTLCYPRRAPSRRSTAAKCAPTNVSTSMLMMLCAALTSVG